MKIFFFFKYCLPAKKTNRECKVGVHMVQYEHLCHFQRRFCTIGTLNPFHSRARTALESLVYDLQESQQPPNLNPDLLIGHRGKGSYRFRVCIVNCIFHS